MESASVISYQLVLVTDFIVLCVIESAYIPVSNWFNNWNWRGFTNNICGHQVWWDWQCVYYITYHFYSQPSENRATLDDNTAMVTIATDTNADLMIQV